MGSTFVELPAAGSRAADLPDTVREAMPRSVQRVFGRQSEKGGQVLLEVSGEGSPTSTVSRLLGALADEDPLGLVGPSEADIAAGRNWWYLVARGFLGLDRRLRPVAFLLPDASVSLGAYGRGLGAHFPESYECILRLCHQVRTDDWATHEGIIGPRSAASLADHAGESAYIRWWVGETAPELAEAISGTLEGLYPFYADLFGNLFLLPNDQPEGKCMFFDHELSEIVTTTVDFDGWLVEYLCEGREVVPAP
jgi:hypothetical protein